MENTTPEKIVIQREEETVSLNENTTDENGRLTDAAIDGMKKAIDNNQQDSPSLNLDPKTNKMFVVGDPNNIQPTKGEYKITYEYTPDMVTEEDKKNLKYIEEFDVYRVEVTYKNCRVKPIYRSKITLMILNIMTEIEAMTEKGYTSENINYETGLIFLNHTDEIIELASMVLGETKEHLAYATELWSFFMQFLVNEPNILQESFNFLQSSLTKGNTATAGTATVTKNATPLS